MRPCLAPRYHTHVPPRQNPMRAALAANKVQIGTWINLARNPAILTLLKNAGLDYARLDMEHSSPSIETVADMAVLARALDFPLVVRPPEGSREWITRLLDIGVWGLRVPQVDTPEIAAARTRGKHVAMLVETVQEAQRWMQSGVQIIAYSSDVAVLRSAYGSAVAQLRQPPAPRP